MLLISILGQVPLKSRLAATTIVLLVLHRDICVTIPNQQHWNILMVLDGFQLPTPLKVRKYLQATGQQLPLLSTDQAQVVVC